MKQTQTPAERVRLVAQEGGWLGEEQSGRLGLADQMQAFIHRMDKQQVHCIAQRTIYKIL